MMLELLMTRQDELDRKVIGNCAGLRFLVLDELHTYRGRQGADVALLVRRVRERLAPEGCSASAPRPRWPARARRKTRAPWSRGVASKLFASPSTLRATSSSKTLERVTDDRQTSESVRPSWRRDRRRHGERLHH
jgi:ATP-dependent helicase YprA (DUF1998 family)